LTKLQSARGTLEQIETSGAATADATCQLADRLADRPQFSAQSFITGRTKDNTPIHRFQMQLDNLTDRPILDLAIIIRSTDG
jgi:hypothetical protein